jgi:uncharacterized membrane protein YhaH (DUF805 family)
MGAGEEPMTTALEGTPKRGVTLTEQANGQRLCRSMFIGHSLGYVILFTFLSVALSGLQFSSDGIAYRFSAEFTYSSEFDFSTVPPLVRINFLHGNVIISGLLFAVALLVWCDLIVRRRHDRGASGMDGVIWLLALVVGQIAYTFDLLPMGILSWLNVLIALGAVYLFIVLVILPGDPGENRYGAVPKPD